MPKWKKWLTSCFNNSRFVIYIQLTAVLIFPKANKRPLFFLNGSTFRQTWDIETFSTSNYDIFKSSLRTINDEERSEKCALVVKLAEEIRDNIENNERRKTDSYLHDTVREMNIILAALKSWKVISFFYWLRK